ncbi:hypothetical protein F5Y09DRAFT_287279 [Xylaria sp. FL1042]|nr:hypothetical protein F5Y09DRAFT_287279 [Xylaria sp. FL1042]
MGKRVKVKPKIDYRHRWPTQQTLVESRVSVGPSRFKRRWKLHVGWLRQRLKRRSSPKPGKSTHPYDTGLGESDSGSGSTSTSTTQDDQRCWRLFARTPHPASPSPVPVPKISFIKAELRPETPKTPVQLLRLLTNPRKSPFPGSRNSIPFDCDKATVRCTNSRVQAQDLQPQAARPVAKSTKMLSSKFKSFARKLFKHRNPGRRLAVRPIVRHGQHDGSL